MSAHLRAVLEELDDDTIHDAITALVTGLVRGMIEDVTARADDIVTGIVDSITGQLAAAAQCAPSNDDQMTEPPAPRPAAKPQHSQDAVQRTCIMCGRTGTRRYIETRAGWCCAPSSAEACARKTAERDAERAAARASDIPAKEFPAKVTPPPASAKPATPTPAVTARCQDCPRAFTLIGRPLQLAVEMHELKHSHIVAYVKEAQS